MRITAKFASTCGRCGAAIAVGSQVEWTRGSPAVHAQCPRRASKPGPRPERSSPRPLRSGERAISRPSKGREDGYEMGACLYLTRSEEYVVITAAGRYRDDDSDEWMLWAYVREASPEESAPVRARRDAEAARREGAELGRAFREAELVEAEHAAMAGIDPQSGSYEAPEQGLTWSVVTDRRTCQPMGYYGACVSVATLSDGRRCVRREVSEYDDYRCMYYVAPVAVAS